MTAAYLMLSFYAKCHLLVSTFAALLLQSVDTHTITYKGERIIGWSMQDGTLRLTATSFPR